MTSEVKCDVLLVNAPWSDLGSPSIQLSILKSIARQEGFECHVLYANLLFAKYVEPRLYSKFIDDLFFLGEWLFSEAVFGSRVGSEASDSDLPSYYIARDARKGVHTYSDSTQVAKHGGQANSQSKHILEENLGADFRNVIKKLKDEAVPAYLSCLAETFDRYEKTRIVGFTSTFNQNMPSIALAKILKERFEDKVVLLGGANCEGVMGPALMRAFPYVDYVVSGEAEESFPSLLKILFSRNNELITNLGGVSYRNNGEVKTNAPAGPIENLDAYPIMDCDDYYQQLGELEEESRKAIERGPIFFECSRGCWWGQHSHCTFCGLNDFTIRFRSKSPDTIIKELVALSKRHNVLSFSATDNILNPSHLIKLLPRLKETGFDFNLFFEVKANMTKQHVKILRESGVSVVQPGIENFSTHVLQLMGKGTTMLQNIQTLKWFEEFGIHVEWNLIGGFPGEREEDYLLLERVIPLLYHLPPPTRPVFTRFGMLRFSPNFDFAEEFGFANVRPKEHCKYIYDLDAALLRNVVYYFDYELPGFESFLPHIRRINALLEEWHRKYYSEEIELSYGRGPDFLEVIDERDGFTKKLSLRGNDMKILTCCDNISSLDMIMDSLNNNGEAPNEPDLLSSIERLEAQRLILSEGGKYLSLPIARNRQ
jgi:ribosomal peptide maturation radical SAM protein 1